MEYSCNGWGKMQFEYEKEKNAPHEAALLRLDCSKAARELKWQGVWDAGTAIEYTVHWYREFYENNCIKTAENLECYCREAEKRGMVWTK